MADIADLLKAGVQAGASDVILLPKEPPLLRVSGTIQRLAGAAPMTPEECERSIYSLLTDAQKARFEEALELDCSFALAGSARFRVNVLKNSRGTAAVMRVISDKIPTPQELGLMPSIVNLTDLPRGLVLVTGPTGSGKTTTLASLIETINQKHHRHILTIEDPIEFMYENKNSIINQREVGAHTKSFAEALKHSLRQNPDVILIGEMRDLETISLAITAAETGHLCFATLHTQDAPSTVDRIIDVFPPSQQQEVRTQVSTTLAAVISQVLLPRKGGAGRICAREVMTMTPAVGNLIREGKTHQLYSAIESGAKFGMISMDQYLAFLVKQGAVTMEDAAMKAHDPGTMKTLAGMQQQPG
ncbi:MAG: type IV pilus twitching motility protein PilT [Elusimicrobia bacterium]|nr:type IV pilus twitching motility protein PilT [Elusimicrobiota bacterium]